MKTNRTTPQWLVDKMWGKALVRWDGNVKKLLEPSAGEGNLLNATWDFFNSTYQRFFKITAVELNKEKCDVLKSKGYNTIHADFLNLVIDEKFDVILAAPPFNNNVDIAHIQKMYTLLNENGFIVSLTSPFWLTNNEQHQVQFRAWLQTVNHKIEILPDMTFVEKGKTVPTAIITIYK
jgi:16S rRNA G966 N2-methylase RsmD